MRVDPTNDRTNFAPIPNLFEDVYETAAGRRNVRTTPKGAKSAIQKIRALD